MEGNMNEEKITVSTPEQTTQESERTFTQAELDAIVGDRLKRERARYADYDALKEKAAQYDAEKEAEKSELEKATERAAALQAELDDMKHQSEVRALRDKVALQTGVPATLLSADTEDELMDQANKILEFAKPNAYPSVKDGGEVTHNVGKRTAKQQFAEWAEEALG